MARPKFIRAFKGPGGQVWRIYHAKRKEHRAIFRMENGQPCYGITYYRGPYKHRIYIDSSLKPSQIWEVTLHELLHVILEDVGMLYVIEEPIVDEVASRLANILEQLS